MLAFYLFYTSWQLFTVLHKGSGSFYIFVHKKCLFTIRERRYSVNMTDDTILTMALSNLEAGNYLKGSWQPALPGEAEGRLLLTLPHTTLSYQAVIRNEWRNHHLPSLLRLNGQNVPLMVVAGHLFPSLKEALREAGIAYLEANGSLFLRHGQVLVWIETGKVLKTSVKSTNRAFTKTGLKVLFRLLTDETAINSPYRQLAAQTGTGLGTITHIMSDLKQEGYLLALTKTRYQLTNKPKLLEKWTEAYDKQLSPALHIGTFRFLREEDFGNWKQLPLPPDKSQWGGEAAADLLTHSLHPAQLTIYTTETKTELIKNYRLLPDGKGNVKAFRKFWTDAAPESLTVPPLLVYADLVNSHDRRCSQTAEKIYDAYLQNQL